MEDYLIESITKIANQKKVKNHCEPRVMQPLDIEEWMTKRVLYATQLLHTELQKEKKSIHILEKPKPRATEEE